MILFRSQLFPVDHPYCGDKVQRLSE